VKKILMALGASLVVAGVSVAPVAAHGPSSQTQVIFPHNLAVNNSSWYFYDDTADVPSATELPGKYQFVTGPATPPAGKGSIKFQTTGSERWNIATRQFSGTKIADLTALKFNTYQPNTNPGNPTNAMYLNFDVDFDGPGGNAAYQGRLVYVPRDNGAVQQNTWQEWNTLASGSVWNWSRLSRGADGVAGTPDDNKWPDGNATVNRTWSDIVAAFPNATISTLPTGGQFLLRAGEPYPGGFTGYTDKVTVGIGSTTKVYDFEPSLRPGSKDDCKNNGWKQFNDPAFKNQGQCVKYVNYQKWLERHPHWWEKFFDWRD
jgi:hypothetical protein